MKYSAIIPTYNEEQTIERAIHETWRVLSYLSPESEILIVDDGSNDRTRFVVEHLIPTFPKKYLQLIPLAHNQGKGVAVKIGILAAKGEKIGFLDADLATHPKELIKGFSLLEQADIAIASRRIPQATIVKPQRWYRSFAGQVFNFILRKYLDLPYFDTQCGCKVFRREVIKTLFQTLKTSGWSFDAEILYKGKKLGYSIVEFPVTWTNGPTSRVQWKTAPRILKELYKIKQNDS